MSIRRLKTLVAIAETGSFGEAAREMYLCRSAVSLQMKALEEEFQATLFDRTKRPPTLNSVGKALVPKAKRIVRAYDAMKATATEESNLSGVLRIGAMPTSLASVIPGALNAMRRFHPNLHISAAPGNSPDLVPKVDQGELDAAVINEPPYLGPHLDFKPFAAEPFIVLTQLDCPIDDPVEILRSQPFVRYTRSLWAGQILDDWLRAKNIEVNQLMEIDNFETIATMVYHGLGASIVPHRCIPTPNPLPLKRLSLGPGAPKRVIGLLVRRDSLEAHLTDLLFERIVELVEAATPLVTVDAPRHAQS